MGRGGDHVSQWWSNSRGPQASLKGGKAVLERSITILSTLFKFSFLFIPYCQIKISASNMGKEIELYYTIPKTLDAVGFALL